MTYRDDDASDPWLTGMRWTVIGLIGFAFVSGVAMGVAAAHAVGC